MPESRDHKKALITLFLSVEREFKGRALVGSDQFLYWDPTNPKKNLAPDLTVRVGAPPDRLKSWKTWELGAPHVGVEVVSDWDRAQERFEKKLERYRQAGICEVVRFDAEDLEQPLRLWDLFDGDLVERDLTDPHALLSDALGLYWCVCSDVELGQTLRLARDPRGKQLVLTPAELAEDAARAALADKETALADKEAALARIAELEAELAKKI